MFTTTQRAYRGLPMEGPIASWYTKNVSRDLRRFSGTAAAVAARVPAGGRILEVAPGPGFLAIDLARRGYAVSAVDISRSFVRIARENAARAGVPVEVRQGDAAALPFGGGQFDFVVCTAAFKNFRDPVGALNEMHRVLTPGGRALIQDLRKDASRGDIEAEVRSMNLSAINSVLTRLIFRFGLLTAAYTRSALEEVVRASAFPRHELRANGIGFDLLLTKAGG
jgi:ubiquinone/menaquinone biosynthesis C-methylase UbiE